MLELHVPTLFTDVVNSKYEKCVHIEHAPVNSRVDKVVLGLFLNYAMSGDRCVIVGKIDTLLTTIQIWLGEFTHKWKKSQPTKGLIYCKFENAGTLILADIDQLATVPNIKVDRLACFDAHNKAADPASYFRKTQYHVYVGEIAERGHWFFEQRNDSAAHILLFPTTYLAEQFDDIIVDDTAHGFERLHLLRDVAIPDRIYMPVLSFLRTRVHIRSDKPLEVLTPRQREVAASQHGTKIVPFEVSLLQRRYLAQKRLAVKQGKMPWYLLLKYRRGGFTTLEQGESYRYFTERRNSDVVTIADTSAKTKRIFGMIKRMHELDPLRVPLSTDSTTQLSGANGSNFFTGTAGGSGIARGDTIQRGHWSETAFSCKGNAAMAEDVRAGLMGAASFGELTFETTANGRNFYYQWWQEAKQGTSDFTPIFIRWFDDPMNRMVEGTYTSAEILETLTDKEAEMMALHGLDVAQIAFRRQGMRRYKKLWLQEFPEDDETCFLTSGTCYFDQERIADLLSQPYAPNTQTIAGGKLITWEFPQVGKKYVIGSDTSEGMPTSDRNGLVVLDSETGEEAAMLIGRWKPAELAVHVKRMSLKYNGALYGVERNNHGHAVLQKLADLDYDRSHIRGGPCYYFRTNSSDDWKNTMTIGDNRPGWDTNASTRPTMLAELSEAFSEGHVGNRCQELLHEMSTFVQHPSGKWGAEDGCHDDVVIMFAIAWQMRKVPRVVGGFA